MTNRSAQTAHFMTTSPITPPGAMFAAPARAASCGTTVRRAANGALCAPVGATDPQVDASRPFACVVGGGNGARACAPQGDTLSGRRRGELAGESVFLTRDVERVVWTLSVVRAVAMVCEIDVLLRVICAGRQAGCGRRFGQYRRRRAKRERCILSPVLNCCRTCEEPLGSGDRIQMSKKTSTDGRRRSRAAHRPRSVVDVK